MKKSLEIIKENVFAIQVTSAYYKGELDSWEKSFNEQGIKTTLKLERTEKRLNHSNAFLPLIPAEYFSLWRQITPRERGEIKRGEWLIKNHSFQKPEKV